MLLVDVSTEETILYLLAAKELRDIGKLREDAYEQLLLEITSQIEDKHKKEEN